MMGNRESHSSHSFAEIHPVKYHTVTINHDSRLLSLSEFHLLATHDCLTVQAIDILHNW